MWKSTEPRAPSQFELRSLAFADLISSLTDEKSRQSADALPQKDPHALPQYAVVRCVCGNNHTAEDMIKCSDCGCYLHRSCLESSQIQLEKFRCPFCRLQIEGIDPFKDLNQWIDSVDSGVQSLFGLISDNGPQDDAAEQKQDASASHSKKNSKHSRHNSAKSGSPEKMEEIRLKVEELCRL